MAVKPESQFISGIHSKLDREVYRMKNNNPYIGGIPDCYYSGNKGDLWVEYKFIPKLPLKVAVKPDVSALQLDWMKGRHAEGRNIALIVGCPEGGVIFKIHEEYNLPSDLFRARLKSRTEIADWITKQTKR